MVAKKKTKSTKKTSSKKTSSKKSKTESKGKGKGKKEESKLLNEAKNLGSKIAKRSLTVGGSAVAANEAGKAMDWGPDASMQDAGLWGLATGLLLGVVEYGAEKALDYYEEKKKTKKK